MKTKAMRGATVPKPFNLSRGTKRKVEETSTYVPMAQLIEQFERRTPERYHLRSRKNQDKGMCVFLILFFVSERHVTKYLVVAECQDHLQ